MPAVDPTANPTAAEPILTADGLVRRFNGLVAVDVDHLEVPRGRITALIGPNGAGKTTTFNLLAGFDRPDEGRWSFDGRDIHHLPAHRIARLGMVRTFQLTRVLGRLSVLDNMLLGAGDQPGEQLRRALLPWTWRAARAEATERAHELLARFTLDAKAGDLAASLSGGQRKLLEMARALMARPTLLMLDEPMAGVNPALTQSLLDHVLALRDEGITVLFVEHDMHVVKHIADHVIVMADGRVIAEGAPREVLTDDRVVDAYLGSHHDTDLRQIIAARAAERSAS
ncbi:ABC transporter ATP-binding protein [Agromyces rhizosphaerae]|uniref:ABC transporter ATP-binding protein n=1 Tax=Agromyces rhizosphaerae TaxID=88374 RepID=A0A9W6CQ35_9MICO|nr:ABC transporter ATP-binding protein [Agromyces rhizosphaerae]GLI26771.1 ABC transporter ATP-binding protein [Agromyces rhizosphaerae]